MHSIKNRLRDIKDPRSKKAVKNVVVSFGLKGLSMFFSFILVPLTLSYLTQYEYGVWLTLSSILVWLDFFDIGLGNGLRNKLTECIAQGEWDKGRSYVSTTFFILCIIGVIVVFLFYIFSYYVDWAVVLNTSDNPIPKLREIVLIVFVLCVINFVMKTVGTIFIANQEPMVSNMFSCFGQAISILLIYLLTKLTNGSLMYVAICFSVSPIIVYLVSYPYAFKYRFPQLTPSIKHVNLHLVKDIAGIGLQFFLIQVVCLILYQSSNIIIAQLFSPSEVTPYNIGYRYMNLITMLFMIIITPLWSAITDAYVKNDIMWIRRSISLLIKIWLGFSILVVVFFLLSSFFIKLWVGESIIVPKHILFAIGSFVVVDMWNRIFASFANGISHLKVQLYSAALEGVLFIPLAILLSKSFGVAGVAWSLMLVSLIPSIALFVDYHRCIKLENNG